MNQIDLIIDALECASPPIKGVMYPAGYHMKLAQALAAARELKALTWREAFICGRCDGVYSDVPVSECDCEVGVEPIFKRGFICYALDEVTK
jgi:hypothetical protein